MGAVAATLSGRKPSRITARAIIAETSLSSSDPKRRRRLADSSSSCRAGPPSVTTARGAKSVETIRATGVRHVALLSSCGRAANLRRARTAMAASSVAAL
jgi:hypothetical protein